jgi:hypothetical protein
MERISPPERPEHSKGGPVRSVQDFAHGGQQKHRVFHPCPVEWTVDVLLQNLIVKFFMSAPTAQDLRLLCHMFEEIPS